MRETEIASTIGELERGGSKREEEGKRETRGVEPSEIPWNGGEDAKKDNYEVQRAVEEVEPEGEGESEKNAPGERKRSKLKSLPGAARQGE